MEEWRSLGGGCGCPDCIQAPEPRAAPRKWVRRTSEWSAADQGRFDRDWQANATPVVPERWLGIDVGFIYPAVDSDGVIYRWASPMAALRPNEPYVVAGSVRVRKADGTSYERGAYDHSELSDVFARARNESYNQNVRILSSHIVKKARESERGVSLEDWSDFKRRRAAWIDVWRKIRDLAERRGCAVRTVPSAWTSVTCPECGHQDRRNRPNRNTFKCLGCGHSGQSDRIAARNIMARAGLREITSETLAVCINPPCGRAAYRRGLCCPCYFYSRRHLELPSKEQLEELRTAKNAAKLKAEWLGSLLPA